MEASWNLCCLPSVMTQDWGVFIRKIGLGGNIPASLPIMHTVGSEIGG